MALIGIATRRPDQSDAAGIAAIDADGLATGHATFRDTPHDWESFLASFLMGRGFALVAEVDNSVVAWAGVSPTSARAVYRGVGEVSIYVSSRVKGRGVGQHLLEKLVVESEHAGYWTLVAQIFPENEASLSLHTALGFNTVGTRTKLGRMGYGPFAGRWRDVIMLERRSHAIE
jgi:L-amino acid N-acyltransferase YncA